MHGGRGVHASAGAGRVQGVRGRSPGEGRGVYAAARGGREEGARGAAQLKAEEEEFARMFEEDRRKAQEVHSRAEARGGE